MRIHCLLVLATAACGEDAVTDPQPDGGTEADVTYYQTIKPILDAKCNACHVAGGIAPFALTDYQAAADNALAASAAVTSNIMPPWPPSTECRDYVGNRSLDPVQIDAIARWVELGTPEGDPSRPGAPLADTLPTLSRVDATLAMPEAYTPAPPAGEQDDYRCFVLPLPATFTQRAFVTGFAAQPGNAQVVHHVIAFLAAPGSVTDFQAKDAAEPGPGYTCFGGAGGAVQGMIGAWAPGSLGSDLPPGIGLPIDAGSAIILQVHYNTEHGAGADQSAIQLKIDTSVAREGRVVPFANPQWPRGNMPIAAGDPDATYSFAADPTALTGELEIYSAALHMHNLGTGGRLEVDHADGTSSCLLQIDDWDFHWQGSYEFAQSTILRRGDKLSIACHWDNSAANQPGGAAPHDVNWGEGTRDEMCIGFLLTAPPQ